MYTLTLLGKKYKTSLEVALTVMIGMFIAFFCSLIGVMRISELFGFNGWWALILLGLLTSEITANDAVYAFMPIAIVRKIIARISFYCGFSYFIYSSFL